MEYWPELQRRSRSGQSLAQLVAWLQTQGITTSTSAVHRVIDRIRATAATAEPPPPAETPKPPPLSPIDDDDELALMKKLALSEMLHGADWKQRHSALRCVIAVRAERRASKEPPRPTPGEQPIATEPHRPLTTTAPAMN